ncbi:acetyl-CoA carboxylase biotin carboxylase subunit [Yanghanlia caeni]|uniref:Biotin carboxylase n=1 Tax=Yanghanlia caeni TaxID=3064283 RepID=A0ABU1D9W4_9BURK|nr:acetyl-CoA carboxylase biotin carboxylase subunit [Alcaligenaceae bacterium LG-2]
MFTRILVANRGEIAVRIIRACHELGVEAVVAVSEADKDSLAATLADRVVCIGPSRATDSYLRPDTLVMAALGTGCQAIHPGYGFLAESATLANLCQEAGLKFIGPSAKTIESMGSKITAVSIAKAAGVAGVPGSGKLNGADEARAIAKKIGYPVLLKASAGGGGRGMRIVKSAAEMSTAMSAAAAEAQAAFGDSTLYMEKFIRHARHIEVQVLGDTQGHIIHLGERDCSTQRRHQKLIEESPSPVIHPDLRNRLGEAAVKLARQVDYQGAGTVEFLFDANTQNFYFLEMNTRIQVEHPVTEMVTGSDLVAEQIRIAAGYPLSLRQADIVLDGHAIECRINAEDPDNAFMPMPGVITRWDPPSGEAIRLDSHCYTGYRIPPFYDSLLGKLIVHGSSRQEAIRLMSDALARFEIEGVPSTIPFHIRALQHEDFTTGNVTTRWVEETLLNGN